MTSSGTYRDRWVAEVFHTHRITDTVRVTLLALAEEMDETGRVVFLRDELAARLGRHPRRISERLKAGIEAGLLRRVARGQRHQATVLQAVSLLVPPRQHEETSSLGADPQHIETSLGADIKHEENGAQCADPQHEETDLNVPPGQHEESRPLKRNRAHARSKRSHGPETTHQMESDHASVGEVIQLFDEGRTIAPPAGPDAQSAEAKPITAQALVAAYVDGVREATGEDPTPRLIGQIARQAKELIDDEKRDRDRLVAAARSLGMKVGRGFTDLGREYLMLAQRNPRAGAATGTDTPGRAPWDPNYRNEDYFSGF